MIAFLTSSPGGSIDNDCTRPCQFDNSNGFVDKLKKIWKNSMKFLMIASSPDDIEMNEKLINMFKAAFKESGLPLSCADICDSRNSRMSSEYLNSYDVVLLSGGHVPTESAFFNKIGLKKCIESYNGIIIGISAGTMNSAETVYAMPELDGEALNTYYKRFIPGLGLTKTMIIPHYQYLKTVELDGQKMIEDIAVNDSMGMSFYGIVDGSYLLVDNDSQRIYGETYLISDGRITKVCEENESIEV